jgi:CO dehydrogenase nickel-insertion accessory protein CooC1
MKPNIYIIAGCKGGVGKSMVSIALLDYILMETKDVVLIDNDINNPDVYKAYKNEVFCKLLDITTKDDQIDLTNLIVSKCKDIVIINTKAGNNKSLIEYCNTYNNLLISELKKKIIILWVINRQRDSLELLYRFFEITQNIDIHVVINGHFGDINQFEIYNNSEIKNKIESNGSKSIFFPDLADRVADDIYSKRLSIVNAIDSLPLGNKAELIRWRNEINVIFKGIIE